MICHSSRQLLHLTVVELNQQILNLEFVILSHVLHKYWIFCLVFAVLLWISQYMPSQGICLSSLCHAMKVLMFWHWQRLDLRVGSSKLTWAFQVGSSLSVVASPSKFSGAIGQCTSHSKQVDLTYKLAPSSSLIQVVRGYGWVWANREICNII